MLNLLLAGALLVSVAEPQVVMIVQPVTFPAHGDAEIVLSFNVQSGNCGAIGLNFGMHWKPESLRYVSGAVSCPAACPDQWQFDETHIDSIVSIIAYSFPGLNPLQGGVGLRLRMHNQSDVPVNACNREVWFKDFRAGCALGGLTTGLAPISCGATDVDAMPPAHKAWSFIKELYR